MTPAATAEVFWHTEAPEVSRDPGASAGARERELAVYQPQKVT